MKPDLVAITGDLVDASVAALRPAIAELARIESRQGVYFVTGNHEYYVGADEWIAELRRLGIRVLRNERTVIGEAGGPSFDLAGIDDWTSHRYGFGHGPDLGRALAGRDPERALVLLAHQPRGVADAVRSGVELQISGHTHGGQIFPFTLVVNAVYPYCRGLYHHREPDGQEGQVFVSCGTGYWGPPLRLGAPAEIARIVLV
jgi:predicted MPP superfamily phosphohydrolase